MNPSELMVQFKQRAEAVAAIVKKVATIDDVSWPTRLKSVRKRRPVLFWPQDANMPFQIRQKNCVV